MKESEIHAGQRESVRDILDENDAYDMQMYGRIVDKPVHVSKCCPDKSCAFCVQAEQREVKWREEYRRRNGFHIAD